MKRFLVFTFRCVFWDARLVFQSVLIDYLLSSLQGLNTVDQGISRHVPDVLQNDDWAAVVFHYIGLDGLAHMGGLKS